MFSQVSSEHHVLSVLNFPTNVDRASCHWWSAGRAAKSSFWYAIALPPDTAICSTHWHHTGLTEIFDTAAKASAPPLRRGGSWMLSGSSEAWSTFTHTPLEHVHAFKACRDHLFACSSKRPAACKQQTWGCEGPLNTSIENKHGRECNARTCHALNFQTRKYSHPRPCKRRVRSVDQNKESYMTLCSYLLISKGSGFCFSEALLRQTQQFFSIVYSQ